MIRAKKKSIDRADHIVCVSENTKKDLIEIYDVDEKKNFSILSWLLLYI